MTYLSKNTNLFPAAIGLLANIMHALVRARVQSPAQTDFSHLLLKFSKSYYFLAIFCRVPISH